MQIKEKLKKCLIFGLESRVAIAVILSFYGYKEIVIDLLMELSHSTWAYIVNSDGLPGFLVAFDIIEHLKYADRKGLLEHARRWHVIDMSKVVKELETQTSQIEMMTFLS